jgi:hypothetical protein
LGSGGSIVPIAEGLSVAIGLLLVLLVLALLAWRLRASRRGRRPGEVIAIASEGETAHLLRLLAEERQRTDAVVAEVAGIRAMLEAMERDGRQALRGVGLVRYNPFPDTGGNQSFAIALVNALGDGLVVTSLHARSGTRIYAKAVTGGRSEGALSDEEAEALRQALAGLSAPRVPAP